PAEEHTEARSVLTYTCDVAGACAAATNSTYRALVASSARSAAGSATHEGPWFADGGTHLSAARLAVRPAKAERLERPAVLTDMRRELFAVTVGATLIFGRATQAGASSGDVLLAEAITECFHPGAEFLSVEWGSPEAAAKVFTKSGVVSY